MVEQDAQLLRVMSDGRFHSGESLGGVLGVSRAAVWKRLQQLQVLGVDVQSVKGCGYRIPGGLSLLNEVRITEALKPDVRQVLDKLEVFFDIASTNGYLLETVASGDLSNLPAGRCCVAERQTSGRGRRGRAWQSPFAKNIYFSILWNFNQGVSAIEGLSLAVGVVVIRALESQGYLGLTLKWPNDILYEGKKLGGVLLEMSGDANGECTVVVGVGVNVQMSSTDGGEIDQPWTDLSRLSERKNTAEALDRNDLVIALINSLVPILREYEKTTFLPFREEWESLAAHIGKEVIVTSGRSKIVGQMVGITGNGGLRVSVGGETRVFLGGEVSLRTRDDSTS